MNPFQQIEDCCVSFISYVLEEASKYDKPVEVAIAIRDYMKANPEQHWMEPLMPALFEVSINILRRTNA